MWQQYRKLKYIVSPVLLLVAYLLAKEVPERSFTWWLSVSLGGLVVLLFLLDEYWWKRKSSKRSNED